MASLSCSQCSICGGGGQGNSEWRGAGRWGGGVRELSVGGTVLSMPVDGNGCE